MPEATPVSTPNVTTGKPAEATSAQPKPVEPTETKPADQKPAEPDRLAEIAAQTKRLASERMKLAHEAREMREAAAKREEAFAKERAELDEWKKQREDRRRNPAKYLTAEYGPDWYDKLSKVQLSGGATPDLIASEVDDRVSASEKRAMERIAALEKQLADRDQQSVVQQRDAYLQDAISYVKSNAEKYPLIHDFEAQGNIAAFIQSHFEATKSVDERGEPVPGEVLTAEQAAEMMEKLLAARVAAVDKRRQLKQAAEKPNGAAPQRTEVSAPRRNLSTDLTGTTSPDRPPAISEAERIRRAIGAWESVAGQNR